MIAIRYYAISLLVFSIPPIFLPAQIIEGKIRSIEGHIPDMATIFLKSESIPPQILTYQTTTTGDFRISISLPQEFKAVIIEIIAHSYKPLSQKIVISNDIEVYKFEFILEQAPPIVLEEVIFTEKRSAITSRNDTIVYKIENFIDGTEQKVQDILKKLPGFEVNEQTGEIKFKGRSIERVLLDGNDLFGLNYVIPTKNINAKIINEIEVIENYNDNPLLKQFEYNNRIAVNLKIEESSLDLSGNIDIGLGLKSPGEIARKLSGDILGIGDKQKSFSTIQHNNVGLNNTPFDFLTFSQNIDDRIDQDFLYRKIIPDRISNTDIDAERTNNNNQSFFNTNYLFSLNKHSGLRINISYYDDVIRISEKNIIENNFDSLRLITSDLYSINRRPRHLRGELDYRNLLSEKIYITCKTKIFTEQIQSNYLINRNKEDNFTSKLTTHETFWGSNLSVSRKINHRNIIHTTLDLTRDIPYQLLTLRPSVIGTNSYNEQMINILRDNFSFDVKWFYGKQERSGVLTTGFSRTHITLNTVHDTLSANNTQLLSYQVYQDLTYTHVSSSWMLMPKLNLKFIRQQIFQNFGTNPHKDFLLPEPSFVFNIKVSEETIFKTTLGLKFESLTESHMFSHPIMISNRIFKTNIPTPFFQRTLFLDFSYLQNNLSKKFQWSTHIRYERPSNLFVQSFEIDELFTYITSRPLFKSWSVFSSDFSIGSFVPVIQSTIKINFNYNLISYFNFVNLSELRKNTNQVFSSELFIKSAFDIPINIENITLRSHSFSYTSNQNTKFSNTILKNTFSIYYKPKKINSWYIRLKNETFVPDLNNLKQYLNFMDLFILLSPLKKKWSLILEFRNLTNAKEYQIIQPTDFSVHTMNFSLFPRLSLLTFTYHL
ncbi:MAG: hypothetical protein ABIM30_08285 [candidate division WOR-3 bacterium]